MKLREGLPPLPFRIARLPLDPERGYPVPWFVQWFHADGVPCESTPDAECDHPDFRVIDARKRIAAVRFKLCWVCGEPLGRAKAFLIGPMCAINRISSEPPSHVSCAEWSAQACPFLSKPHMVRRQDGLPEEKESVGMMIMRNPGVTLLWVTCTYKLNRNGLFEVGDPTSLTWYAEGRIATRAEVEESMRTGLPTLREAAEQDGDEGVRAFERAAAVAQAYLPEK